MNNAEVSGLLCGGMHETVGGEESYTAEYPKMDQDTSHGTTKFGAVMTTSATYTDHINTDACLDEYHMSGIQHMEDIRFGSAQPLLESEGMTADCEEESMPSSLDTSSTSNYDIPGFMEQNLQHIYSAYDAMVDKEGPVVLSPAFIIYNKASHVEPNLAFASDWIKIEYLNLYSSEDEKMITLQWEISNIISISCKWIQSVGSAFITILAGSEAETGNAGSARVQFCLDDSQWPRRRQKIWDLGQRYQEIWEDIPSDDFTSKDWSIEPSLFFPRQYFSSTDDFEDVIFPQGDPDAVSISKRDVELLLPETFVNDTIIDFYIKYLSTRIESTEKHKYHFFNSFFFRKLADLDKDQGRAPEGRVAFLRVRKWTRKINIFEKDFLFIPVNFNLHWSLIVICYPGEVMTFEGMDINADTKHSAKLPCILHMDSLKGSHAGLKDIIQSYLWEEWKERHPESASDNSDKFLNLRFVSLELPQQDNSFDCGLFLLHYVEQFLTDVPSNFNPLRIDVFSGFLSDDWFAPAEASLKRSVVRKLIHELVTGSYEDHPKLSCGSGDLCGSEQLDERHQICSNAEREPTGEFLGQKCSAGEPETVCTVVDVPNHKGPEVCAPDKDTVVCLSSHDEGNELLAESNMQLSMISSAPEDVVHMGSNCVVTNEEHGALLSVSSEHSQKNPSQGAVGVQDIMISTSCSISEITAQAIACQEYSFQRSTEIGDGCSGPSQDTGSVMMPESRKDDDGPITERMAAEGDCGDPHEDMDSVVLGDIDKDIANMKCKHNIVDPITARNAIIENVKEDSLVDPVTVENAIIEDVKEISTADPVTVEDSILKNVKDIGITADNVNRSELYVSSQLPEGNADNGMTGDGSELKTGNTESKEENIDQVVAGDCTHESGITVKDSSSNVNEGNTDQIISGDCTNETDANADGEDADKYLAIDGAVPCEADTTYTDGVRLSLDAPCSTKNETVSEDTSSDAKRPLTDETSELVDRPCRPKSETSENTSCDGKRPAPDTFEENDTNVPGDKCNQKDDGQGTEAKKERHYKRRKVLALERQQSFSEESCLD
ncbi:hypothetical protein U9M48_033394 [Paspalum notatum var. saurae]|uniref:Ubiquitin-like protease family profile domain-containing protein n=1 Tax=Paspalum notatum var. saurae TaxID=547442 RepID=A0AAQ3U7B4_PASNO